MVAQAQQEVRATRRRIASDVALALLEVMRSQDLPTEILEDEDVTVTLPRRLGLSDVVDSQIRRYREEVRKRHKLTDAELSDLVGLVIRRPDSEEVLEKVGRHLALGAKGPPARRRFLPRRVALPLARRRIRKRLRGLFGRDIGRFGPGELVLIADDHILIHMDPGGDGCALVSGLGRQLAAGYVADAETLRHTHCRALGDSFCQWTLVGNPKEAPTFATGDLGKPDSGENAEPSTEAAAEDTER